MNLDEQNRTIALADKLIEAILQGDDSALDELTKLLMGFVSMDDIPPSALANAIHISVRRVRSKKFANFYALLIDIHDTSKMFWVKPDFANESDVKKLDYSQFAEESPIADDPTIQLDELPKNIEPVSEQVYDAAPVASEPFAEAPARSEPSSGADAGWPFVVWFGSGAEL